MTGYITTLCLLHLRPKFVDASIAAIQRQKMDYSNPDFDQEEAKKVWESLLSKSSPSDEELVSAVKKGQ